MAVEESEMSTAAPEPSVHPIEERLGQLTERREQALHAGSEASVQRQHDRGRFQDFARGDGSGERGAPADDDGRNGGVIGRDK